MRRRLRKILARVRGLRGSVEQRQGERLMRRTAAALVAPAPRNFAAYGRGTFVVPPARIVSPEFIEIGERVQIHEHVWLEVQRRPGAPAPRLHIASDSMLNRFVKIVCCGSVTLRPGAILGDRVYISDVEYLPGHADLKPGERLLTDPAPVVIGAGVLLGVGVIVKPGVTIGDYAYVGAGSVVTEDVPERALAVGNPARVVRQADPETGVWERVKSSGA